MSSKLSNIDLTIFAAIAETEGITAAAKRLKLTKSLVSRGLADLEDRLGQRLVNRTTRKVSLTESGKLLAQYAQRVIEEIENAETALELTRDVPRGSLHVSVPVAIARFYVAPRISEFYRKYPDVRISFDATSRVANLVEDGIDVAIRIGELTDSSLVSKKLVEVPQVFVASPVYLKRHGTPVKAKELSSHDILSLGSATNEEAWSLEIKKGVFEKISVTPRLSILEPGLLLDFALQGLGIAPIPLPYAEESLEKKKLVRVLPEIVKATVPIFAVYPSRRMLSPKVRAFIDFATEIIGPTTPRDP